MSNSTDWGQSMSNSTHQINELMPLSLSLHINSMPFIWSIAIDITIFLAFYKYRPYAQWLHVLGGIICAALTLTTSLPTLLELPTLSPNDPHYYHYVIGIMLYIMMFSQIILGGLSRVFRLVSTIKSIYIYRINKVHMVLGYTLAVLAKMQVMLILNHMYLEDIYNARYEYNSLIFNVFWNSILIVLYIWRKNTIKKIEQSIAPLNVKAKMLQIQGLDELDGNSYIIFANYVYELQPLSHLHPVGYQVLKTVRGRSVDRFLYGMYTSEKTPSLPIHSHSLKSLALLQPPVAKLVIPEVYDHFDEVLNVRITSEKLISVLSMTHQVTLQPIGQSQLQFMGYTKKSQLGRHYAVTLNKSITRLYTYVHFLQPKNLCLLAKIAPHKRSQLHRLQKNANISEVSDIRLPQSEGEENFQYQQHQITENSAACIPLMIKRYEKGRMTGQLFQGIVNSLQISRGRGEGLKLRNLTSGTFCIVAGGTGLFPFCDLIDLLYKQKIIKKQPEHQDQIIKHSPILAERPFQNMSFVLLLAVASLADIHPITLMQIQELASEEYFQVTLKIKLENLEGEMQNIRVVSQPFEQIIESFIDQIKITKFWICGPPRMNEAMAVFFKKLKVKNYRFL